MSIDLLKLTSGFEAVADTETAHAHFRTRVASVAPYAYLHIIFKPCEQDLLDTVAAELRLPPSLVDFYRSWNGASLFLDELEIRGCLRQGQLLNRTDPFAALPYDLRESNRGLASRLGKRGLIRVGSYRCDGSIVCLFRDSPRVECYVEEDLQTVRQAWGSVNEWLTSEIARMSLLFDSKGNCLVTDKHFLLPGTEARPN